jgi:arsenate reductase
MFSYVITVCDEASGERCPIFPGISKKIHWGFSDPSALQGSFEERLRKTIVIRNQIQNQIEKWLLDQGTSNTN